MKKLLSLLAAVFCLSVLVVAQDAPKAKKKAVDEGPKLSQLSGCLTSAGAGYTLTNGHYKSGVAVTGPDELKSHVGHQVRMKGTWSEPKKSYKAEAVSMVAETCPAPGSAAAGGKTKAGKAKGEAPKP
jgi:hypothetical protein